MSQDLLLPSYLPIRHRARGTADWPPGINSVPMRLGRRRVQRMQNEAFLEGPIEFDKTVDGSTMPFDELPFFQRGVAFTALAARLEALGLSLGAEMSDVCGYGHKAAKPRRVVAAAKRQGSAASSGDEAWVVVSRNVSKDCSGGRAAVSRKQAPKKLT